MSSDYDVIVLGGGSPGERLLADHGIELLRGSGRLAGAGIAEVAGPPMAS